MARIKGNKKASLEFDLDGASSGLPVDLGAYVVNYEFVDGEGEALTQHDYNNGVRPVALEVEYALEFGPTTAFGFHTANAGTNTVAYALRADGDVAISEANPEFYGTCTMPPAPLFGVEAGNEEQTFSVTIQLDSYNMATS